MHTGANAGPPIQVRFFEVFENLGVLMMLGIVLAVMAVIAPAFFVPTNLNNLVIRASIIAVAGFGMTLAIAMRGLDLSVGSAQALTACIAASLLTLTDVALPLIGRSLNIPLTIVGTLAAGALLGVINGLLISKLKVPPFVATLGMMGIVRGAALLITDGRSVLITGYEDYALLNTARVVGLPVPLLIALATLAACHLVLRHTPFGRHVCAVGGNRAAAVASGLNVDRITIAVYALVGLTTALSGIMLSAQLMIVDGTLGAGLELSAIAIAVLGGTSLAGGNGNLVGTLIGALLLTAISSALNILKVPAFYQYLAIGSLLIFALALDTGRRALISSLNRRTP